MTDLEKAEEYFDKGIEKYQTGNYLEAIQDNSKAIELNSKHMGAYNNRGLAFAQLGEHERAVKDFSQIIKLNPKDVEAYNNRGNAYADLGEYERAIEDYDQAITLDHQHAKVYYNRGNSYLKLDQDKRAIEDYDQAIKLNPKDAGAYYNRGNCYAQIGKTHEAKNDFLKLIKFTKEPPYEGSDLYKYIPINHYQILSIINQDLYFTPYGRLNDPLECFFINHENKDSAFGASLKQEGIQACVLALTHQPESKLMYSHYADGHQGLCIEYQLNFNSLKTNDLITYGKVFYGEKSRVENLNDFYLLKNSDWKYEEEYRLVRFDDEKFHSAKIISITFAFRCNEDHRKIIYELSKHHSNIVYWEMRQKNNTNDLERVQIDDADKYSVDDPTLFKLMLKHAFQDIYHYFQNHR